MYRITANAIVFTTLVIGAAAETAEFSGGDVIPNITSLVFASENVGLTLETYYSTLYDRDERYFIADRKDYVFRQVSKQKFEVLIASDHHRNFVGVYEKKPYSVRSNRCADDGFAGDNAPRIFDVDGQTFAIDMKCRSSVADGALVNGELWIATIQYGGHGDYAAEGLLIASLDGRAVSRIDLGRSPASGVARDPWTENIWIVTWSRLTVVKPDHDVLARYWPTHDFDVDRERPDVFVSQVKTRVNPLAIVAYSLGEKHYREFFRAIRNGVDLPDGLLYDIHMSGYPPPYNPILPSELNVLISVAEPTVAWHRFVCMLPDDRAKNLCGIKLDEWPGGE